MPDNKDKLLSREQVISAIGPARAKKLKVGFTSGVFDLLHPGHVDYLAKARGLCDLLVVGVNSDSSVRENKGESRPICSEIDRAKVVAGLGCVDNVFIFSEKNNNRNIELLKPDFYIKAGDYDRSKLSSAPLVDAYGGRVELIPTLQGYSTTKIIEKISTLVNEGGFSQSTPRPPEAPAVFLDRDGTIIEHVEYLHEPSKMVVIPGAFEAIRRLREAGFRIVVVTNQPGIGLGYFTKENLFSVNREMMRQASKAGAAFDKIYFCPHSQSESCSCRKPSTGMVDRAVRELNIKLSESFIVGDMTVDVMLGKNAGCRSILVQTGYGGADKKYEAVPDFTAPSLVEASELILKSRKK